MPIVRVIDRDGAERELNAPDGATLMEPLRDMDNGVAAICGGMCSCATCHVYVDEEWVAKLPAAMSDETDMLGDLNSRKPNSRLSCQVVLNDSLSGLKVTVAPEE
jgi:ferredoxin, 2Fe-2S